MLIPKIVHIVWIGPKPFPYQDNLNTWKEHNPDWEVWFWDNDKVNDFWPDMVNKKAFEQVPYWSGKTNVLRYELLYKYGGVYSDADSYCLRPLEPLLKDLVCFGMTGNRGRVCAATLGCVPGHPAFEQLVYGMEAHLKKMKKKQKKKGTTIHKATGAGYISPVLSADPTFTQIDKGAKEWTRKNIIVWYELPTAPDAFICQQHAGSWKEEEGSKTGRIKL